MSGEVELRLKRAQAFLRQALVHDPINEAESVIDAGYYAMFHAASAVLIAKQGSAPKTHSGVVGQFGMIVSRLGELERQAGKSLNRALDDRLVSHYDPDPEDLPPRAARIKSEARVSFRFARSCVLEIAARRSEPLTEGICAGNSL